MNKNLVIGAVFAISLLMLIQFPDDTITLIENIGSVGDTFLFFGRRRRGQCQQQPHGNKTGFES